MCLPGRDGSLAAARSLAAALATAGDDKKADEEEREEDAERRRRALAAASKAPTSATPRAATHSRSGARPVQDRRSSSLTPSERLFRVFFFEERGRERSVQPSPSSFFYLFALSSVLFLRFSFYSTHPRLCRKSTASLARSLASAEAIAPIGGERM